MYIIIDGYNVLKLVNGVTHSTDRQRQHFIALLNSYARLKGHRIILVFDGGPYDRIARLKQHDLEIIYSGPHDSADDVIISLLKNFSPENTLIVSSDRGINQRAAAKDFISIDAHDFYHLVTQAVNEQPKKIITSKIHKFADYESSGKVDALMEIASNVPMHKSEEQEDSESGDQKLSKKEKKMQALLKKL